MDSPPPSASSAKGVFSTPSSPVLKSNQLAHASNSSHPRHMSDVSSQPVGFGPRASGALDPINQFKFGDIVTSTGQILPKRVFQGKKKDLQAQQNSMAHIQRGGEIPGLPAFPGDRGRHSIAGPSMRPGSKSRSPHQRLGARSGSPGNSLIQGRTLSPAGRALLQDKAYPELDMSNAYRKLSDMNRLRHGGLLGNTVVRKKSADSPGGGRLVKDYFSPDGDELLDDSSDEEGYSTQEEGNRGRKADRDFDEKNGKSADNRAAKSLLAAAEEERKFMMSRFARLGSHSSAQSNLSSNSIQSRNQRCQGRPTDQVPISFRRGSGDQSHGRLRRCGVKIQEGAPRHELR